MELFSQIISHGLVTLIAAQMQQASEESNTELSGNRTQYNFNIRGKYMSQSLTEFQERLFRVQQVLSPYNGNPPNLSDEVVNEIVSLISSQEFLHLPLESLFSFLDCICSAYGRTHHSSAIKQASVVSIIFQTHLKDEHISLSRLLKTYDLLYFLYWCAAVSIEQQKSFNTEVVIPFSKFLERNFSSFNMGHRLDVNDRRINLAHGNRPIRLCYMAEFLYKGHGNALLPVVDGFFSSISGFYAKQYELFLYAWRYHEPDIVEKFQSLGVTTRCFDLREYSENELFGLRNSFFSDRIDIVITDMNSSVPHYLYESRVAPIQIFYQLGMPFWKLVNLDAVLQGWHTPPKILGFDPEKCYLLTALLRHDNPTVDPEQVRNERNRFPQSTHTIGFYGRLVKVTGGYLEIIHKILQSRTDTIVVLGGTGDATLIRNFIRENNLEEQLFVIDTFVDGHLWGHFLDIFLDTFPLMGAYSCLEIMNKSKPVVYMKSNEMPNIAKARDPELLAANPQKYIEIVSRLLSNEAKYHRACEKSIELARKLEENNSQLYADRVHLILQEIISGYVASRKEICEA